MQIVKTFQSLLQIAQMEGGTAKQHFTPVDLGKLAVACLEIYQPDGKENGQIISHILADTALFIVTGAGLAQAEHDDIRRRIYRLKHCRATEGNGLGLSLVDAIRALHDAPLSLHDNAPGLAVQIRFVTG